MFSVKKEKPFTAGHESLIIGLFDQPVKFEGELLAVDEAFAGGLTELVKSGDISAKKKNISKIHTLGKMASKRLYFVGLGKEKALSFEVLREVFGAVFKTVKEAKLEETAIYLDSFISENIDVLDAAHALSEAFALINVPI